MARVSLKLLSPQVTKTLLLSLKEAFKGLSKEEDAQAFLYDFLTPQEKLMLAKRLAIGILAYQELHYREICDLLQVTPTTIQKVKLDMEKSLKYKKLFEKLSQTERFQRFSESLRKASQNKEMPGQGTVTAETKNQSTAIELVR